MSHAFYLKCLDCNQDVTNSWDHTTEYLNHGDEFYRIAARERFKIIQASKLLWEASQGLSLFAFHVAYDLREVNESDLIEFLTVHAAHKIALCGEYSSDPVTVIDPA